MCLTISFYNIPFNCFLQNKSFIYVKFVLCNITYYLIVIHNFNSWTPSTDNNSDKHSKENFQYKVLKSYFVFILSMSPSSDFPVIKYVTHIRDFMVPLFNFLKPVFLIKSCYGLLSSRYLSKRLRLLSNDYNGLSFCESSE